MSLRSCNHAHHSIDISTTWEIREPAYQPHQLISTFLFVILSDHHIMHHGLGEHGSLICWCGLNVGSRTPENMRGGVAVSVESGRCLKEGIIGEPNLAEQKGDTHEGNPPTCSQLDDFLAWFVHISRSCPCLDHKCRQPIARTECSQNPAAHLSRWSELKCRGDQLHELVCSARSCPRIAKMGSFASAPAPSGSSWGRIIGQLCCFVHACKYACQLQRLWFLLTFNSTATNEVQHPLHHMLVSHSTEAGGVRLGFSHQRRSCTVLGRCSVRSLDLPSLMCLDSVRSNH